ncbi:MAG: hypothetical protein WCD18_24870, partial [Thermosynechococcaceae cyanobacterium]
MLTYTNRSSGFDAASSLASRLDLRRFDLSGVPAALAADIAPPKKLQPQVGIQAAVIAPAFASKY